MDLENQKRVLNISEEHGAENVVVLLGAAEAEASAGKGAGGLGGRGRAAGG